MSNAKIRAWIFRAVVILILAGIGLFVLIHPSKLTEHYLKTELFSVFQEHFQDVADYLQAKKTVTAITGLPTIDEHYGIPSEDTDAYRDCNEGIIMLMRSEITEIVSTEKNVQFITPKSGGLLNQEYAVIVYGDAPPTLHGAPCNSLDGKKWFYYIVTEKE